MDIINEIRQELDALADARGISKSVLIVDIAQKLSILEKRLQDAEEAAKADEAPDDADCEVIGGKTYKYGEVMT